MTIKIKNPNLSIIGSPVVGGTANQVLYVDSAGNMAGDADFTFDGSNVTITKQLISSLAAGTAPFSIASTTLVTNLNADLWDGFQFADYLDQPVRTISSPSFAEVFADAFYNVSGLQTNIMNMNGAGEKIIFTAAAGVTMPALTATSFIIGANTLTTTEWANLDGQDQTVATTSSPTFVRLTLSQAIGTSPFAITSTTVNTNLNADLLDGAHVGTSGATVPLCNTGNTWGEMQTFSATTDSFGRLVLLSKTNYTLASTQYLFDMNARTATSGAYGAGSFFGLNFTITLRDAAGTQSGGVVGSQGAINITGAGTITGAVSGAWSQVDLNSAAAVTAIWSLRSRIRIINTATGSINTAYAIYVDPIDAQDGTITTGRGLYISSPSKDTGTFTTYDAIWIDDATAASTNRGVVVDSDTIGLTLGAGQDAIINYDGTDVVLNTALVGSGVLKLANATNWTANGTGTVTISNLAPAGVGTATIGKWLTVKDDAGTVYYIMAFT